MIILPQGDPATERWAEIHRSVAFLLKTLPQGNGMAYALGDFKQNADAIEHDAALSLCIRDLRPYFAALVSHAMCAINGTVRSSQPNFSYVEGAYYGYHYLHVLLRLNHDDRYQDLGYVWRCITQAHITGQGAYKDVLGYIRSDIEKMRHPTVDALRKDTLKYLDKIRCSALADKQKQQTVLACCTVLGCFH